MLRLFLFGANRFGADCYPQVPKRPLFILVPALALVMALVRYFFIVLVDLPAQNDHLEQIFVRIETIE
jgi:hypothetical protein